VFYADKENSAKQYVEALTGDKVSAKH